MINHCIIGDCSGQGGRGKEKRGGGGVIRVGGKEGSIIFNLLPLQQPCVCVVGRVASSTASTGHTTLLSLP